MKYTTKLTKRQIQIGFAWPGIIMVINWITQGDLLLAIIIGCVGAFASFAAIPLIELL